MLSVHYVEEYKAPHELHTTLVRIKRTNSKKYVSNGNVMTANDTLSMCNILSTPC